MCKPKMPAAPVSPYAAGSRYDAAKAELEAAKKAEAEGAPPVTREALALRGGKGFVGKAPITMTTTSSQRLQKAQQEFAAAERDYINSGAQGMREAEQQQAQQQQAAYDRMMADQRASQQAMQQQYQQMMAAQQQAQQQAFAQQAEATRIQQEAMRRQADEARQAQEEAMTRARAESDARAAEQRRISQAMAAPAANPSATDARASLGVGPGLRSTGRGRRRYRTGDSGLAIAGGGLNIPVG